MKVSVEKLPTSEAVLDVDLTWDELEKASDKAYRKLVQTVDIHGFRRGRAPRSLVERKVGKEHIYQEGLDELMTEAYRNAVKEHELTPVAPPQVDAPEFELGQPYHFTVTVPILTPVELGEYHTLHFEREEPEVTSEEVEKELETLREQRATWQTVERPAAVGDRVTVDLKLVVADETISDLKDNPFELTDERHGLFTGMDEQVSGMQAGESKSFTTTIPEDYTNEKLAGKEANYDITMHKIETKELPELDDTFASEISDGQYTTLEDVRKAISDSILETKKRRALEELRDKVVNAVVAQSTVTLHPTLVKEEAEEMLHQISHLLEQQHMSVDQYLLMMRKTREEYLQEVEPEAEKRVKRQLVLDAVAKQEEIQVSAEDLEALFQAYAQAGQNLQRTEAQARTLVITYMREKAISRLVDLAAGPDPDAEEVQAEEEEQSVTNAEAAALTGATETTVEDEIAAHDIVEEDSATIVTEESPADTIG
ncbi:MAG: trigger factor [Chloroflexota bacterium]|nr:trigger factor [Chloroflexota bacterium]